MSIDFIRKELRELLPIYYKIRDCLDGESCIKNARAKYLPQPNPTDESYENLLRYNAYLERAVFYNATRRTLEGMLGQVFRRDPIMDASDELKPILENTDGGSCDIVQLTKRSVSQVLAYGRSGLFIDIPVSTRDLSLAEVQSGMFNPTIRVFEPWSVINWGTRRRGTREILEFVIIKDDYVYRPKGGYDLHSVKQYRILELVGDVYKLTIERGNEKYTFVPVDAEGQPFNEIPFVFIGSENNDPAVDRPPMADLAVLNIAHYRNSADYEESCYIVGQPTPFFSGLTEDWVQNVLGGTVTLGARAAIPLPQGGNAGLLQASPNTMPFEAMQHKEKQMISIGAKLVTTPTIERTATEVYINHASEHSALMSSSKNVTAAYQWALKKCCQFLGIPDDFKFELNTAFDLTTLSPEEQRVLVESWQQGAIAFTELRDNLRRGGVASLEDDKVDAEENNIVRGIEESTTTSTGDVQGAGRTLQSGS